MGDSKHMIEAHVRTLREELELSQDQLATLAGISRHAVMRMEQLCYPNALPSVVLALSELTGVDEDSIISDYRNDVHRNRFKTGRMLLNYHPQLIEMAQSLVDKRYYKSDPVFHPFTLWREDCANYLGVSQSLIHFSMMTSIHPATLSKWEDFKTGYPVPAEVAFKEMQLPDALTELFKAGVFNQKVR